MIRITGFTVFSFFVVGLAAYLLHSRERASELQQPVILYCAASNRAVIDACCREYEKSTGNAIQVQFGASQTLLSSIEVSRVGDLYLPADESYLDLARLRALITSQRSIATMKAVVVVRKGNPKAILTFDDLMRRDVRLVQANPDAAAIGKVVRDSLVSEDKWDKLAEATIAFRGSVTDVANDIVIGTADAGIVYDVMLHSYAELNAVPMPEFKNIKSKVGIGVLASSKRPQVAGRFVDFLTHQEGGLVLYSAHGFDVTHAR